MLIEISRVGSIAGTYLERAEKYAPYAAPVGWRWEFVTDSNERVTENNEPVVDLVRIL